MSRLQLVRILTGNQILTMTDRPGTRLEAKPGARYQLLDGASYKPVEEYVEKRKGYDLEIWLEDSLFVVIEDFFIPDMRAVMLPPEYGQPEPEVDEEYETLLASDESSGSAWQAYLTTGVAILGGGALGYSLFGNKDEGSSGASNSVESLLSVTAVAGAFTSAATVRVYDAEGNLLGEGGLDPETGQVAIRLSVASDYSDPVLIVVSDANGAEADYISEATNQGTSLDTDLRALASLTAGESLVVSVTPVTELVVRLAISQAEMAADIESLATTPLTQDHLALNATLADLLRLDDVLGEVLTIDSDDFDASDAQTAADFYGALLALLSGIDAIHEGVDASLDALLATLTLSDGVLQMSSAGTELLQQGWEQFLAGPNADLLETPPLIDDLPSVAKREEGWVVKVPGAEFGDVLEITLGDQTFFTDVLPTTSNIENGAAIINIQPAFLRSIGLGEHDLQVKVGEQLSPAVAVTLIEAPVALEITLGSDELGTGDASTIVTFTFSNTVEGFSPEEDINVSSGTLTNFDMMESERVWTAIYTPAEGVQDTEVLISVSTDFTDGQGLAPQEESDGVAATGSIRVDTLNPTATLTLSTTHLSRGEEGTLTIVFSEPVQGFTIGDIELTGGLILGELAASGDGVTWVVPISAPNNLTDIGTIDLSSEWADLVGNGAGAVEPISVVIDTELPEATLEVAQSELAAGESTQVTITFSEPVVGFSEDDLEAENGTLSNFQQADDTGLIWTATFTLGSDTSITSGSISLVNGYTDAVGNPSLSFGGVVAKVDIALEQVEVLIDLVNGDSSLDSDLDRSFDTDTAYSIYVRVDSDASALDLAVSNRWSGAENLGADDQIILVGDDGAVLSSANAETLMGGEAEVGAFWWGADESDVSVTLDGATITRLTPEASDTATWLTGAAWDSDAAPNQNLSPADWVIEEIAVEISDQFVWG